MIYNYSTNVGIAVVLPNIQVTVVDFAFLEWQWLVLFAS